MCLILPGEDGRDDSSSRSGKKSKGPPPPGVGARLVGGGAPLPCSVLLTSSYMAPPAGERPCRIRSTRSYVAVNGMIFDCVNEDLCHNMRRTAT